MSGFAHILVAICCCALAAATCGCTSSNESPHNMRHEAVQAKIVPASCVETKGESVAAARQAPTEKAKALRQKSEHGWNNEGALRDFALKESPKLWQTIQSIRAQVATRRKGLARLKADLQEFNIKPESDADCRRLQGQIDSLLDGLADVFCSLEQAYIAAKKFELSPSSANNEEAMKRALEEGVKEADSVARRYELTNGYQSKRKRP